MKCHPTIFDQINEEQPARREITKAMPHIRKKNWVQKNNMVIEFAEREGERVETLYYLTGVKNEQKREAARQAKGPNNPQVLEQLNEYLSNVETKLEQTHQKSKVSDHAARLMKFEEKISRDIYKINDSVRELSKPPPQTPKRESAMQTEEDLLDLPETLPQNFTELSGRVNVQALSRLVPVEKEVRSPLVK